MLQHFFLLLIIVVVPGICSIAPPSTPNCRPVCTVIENTPTILRQTRDQAHTKSEVVMAKFVHQSLRVCRDGTHVLHNPALVFTTNPPVKQWKNNKAEDSAMSYFFLWTHSQDPSVTNFTNASQGSITFFRYSEGKLKQTDNCIFRGSSGTNIRFFMDMVVANHEMKKQSRRDEGELLMNYWQKYDNMNVQGLGSCSNSNNNNDIVHNITVKCDCNTSVATNEVNNSVDLQDLGQLSSLCGHFLEVSDIIFGKFDLFAEAVLGELICSSWWEMSRDGGNKILDPEGDLKLRHAICRHFMRSNQNTRVRSRRTIVNHDE